MQEEEGKAKNGKGRPLVSWGGELGALRPSSAPALPTRAGGQAGGPSQSSSPSPRPQPPGGGQGRGTWLDPLQGRLPAHPRLAQLHLQRHAGAARCQATRPNTTATLFFVTTTARARGGAGRARGRPARARATAVGSRPSEWLQHGKWPQARPGQRARPAPPRQPHPTGGSLPGLRVPLSTRRVAVGAIRPGSQRRRVDPWSCRWRRSY